MSNITDTIRNGELSAMVAQLQAQQDRRADFIVPASALQAENGLVRITGDDTITLNPTKVMIDTLAEGYRLDLPTRHLHDFHGGHDDPTVALANLAAFDAMVNARLAQAAANDKSFMVRTFTPGDGEPHGVGRAVLSDSYKTMDNFDTLMGALQAINESGVQVEVQSVDLTETRMRVRLWAPAVQYIATEFLKGYRNPFGNGPGSHGGYEKGEEPIVFAGFELSNSETGGGALAICPRFMIQACRNGAKITQDLFKVRHRGARLEHGEIDYADDTKEAAHDLTIKMTRDAVRQFINPEYLERKIKELEVQAGAPVPASQAPKVVEQVAKSQQFSKAEAGSILDMFFNGGQMTAGGVMQAVTAAAQLVPDPERAAAMEDVAIDVMHEAARLVAV